MVSRRGDGCRGVKKRGHAGSRLGVKGSRQVERSGRVVSTCPCLVSGALARAGDTRPDAGPRPGPACQVGVSVCPRRRQT